MLRGPFTFEGLYGGPMESWARATLRSVGIEHGFERDEKGEAYGWTAVAMRRGIGEDSEQVYAARILDLLRLVRGMVERGDAAEAARLTFELGSLAKEASIKFKWEKHAVRGKKNVDGARQGHEATHGTAEEKNERWRSFARDHAAEVAKGFGLTAADEIVAERHDVSPKTVQRARNRVK
jgi:hypothetical protein